jgi:hypothetical protein
LEDFDACETNEVHRSSIPNKKPCKWCERNSETSEKVLDFYCENWVLEKLPNEEVVAIIEEPNSAEQLLLNVLNYCSRVYEKQPQEVKA